MTLSLSSISSLLKTCTTSTHLQQVHAQIVRKGLEQHHFLISQLIVRLSRSLRSSLPYQASVFDRVLCPNTCLWNVLVRGFCEDSRFAEAVSVFVRMRRRGVFADRYTFPLLVKLCASEVRFREGMCFHGLALRCGVDFDVFVRTSLIDFYGKCREVVCARKLFDEMSERNVVSCTAMVVGYVVSGDLVEAKRVFDEMPTRNVATWNAMLDGYVKSGDLISARRVFDSMPERNSVSFTAMIDGYAKNGDMGSARLLFDRAPVRDVFAWSALISGFAQNGQLSEALRVLVDMIASDVKPDEYVVVSLISACAKEGDSVLAKWVDDYVAKSSLDVLRGAHLNAALIDMNAKCGDMERATRLFERATRHDVISYCSMIQGLSIHGRVKEAISLFDAMLNEGLSPDEVSLTVILTACSRGGFVAEGLRYFDCLRNKYSIVPSPDNYACIVDLLSRSGYLEEAYEILNSMPSTKPYGCAWGALLGACKLHGDTELGELVGARVLKLEPRSSGNYVTLSQIYAESERWVDVSLVRAKMDGEGVQKVAGRSWINSEE